MGGNQPELIMLISAGGQVACKTWKHIHLLTRKTGRGHKGEKGEKRRVDFDWGTIVLEKNASRLVIVGQ